jgi:hypothetical protein
MSIITMTEEEWAERKNYYKERLSSIVIPLDITPGVAKGLLSRIDAFFSELRLELSEIEGRKERIDNLVREWERAKANGTNEIARKRNATEAIQNYPISDDETINLYEVQRQMTERLSFVQGVIDILNGKQSRLITTTGLLKLEKELSPHANIGWDAGRT